MDSVILRGVAGDVTVTGVVADAWHHIAFVYDDSALTITPYLNGIAQAAEAQSGALSLAGPLLTIGGRSTGTSWDGEVDEFRIWSSARSASQIADNMYTVYKTGPYLTLNNEDPTGSTGQVNVGCPFSVTVRIAGLTSVPQPFVLLAGQGVSKGLLPAPWGGSIDIIAPVVVADGLAPSSGFDFLAKTDFEITYVAPAASAGGFGPAVQAIVQDGSNPPFFLKSTTAGQPFFDSSATTTYNALSDDGFATHALSAGVTVNFGGVSYTELHIGANGQITFGFGDTDFSPTTSEFFAGFQSAGTSTPNPGVAAAWADYNRSGLIDEITVCESGSSTVVVEYKNQTHWSSGMPAGSWSCAFQENPGNYNYTPGVRMDFTAYLPHLAGTDQDPIVGVSDGDDTDGGLDTLTNLSNPGYYVTPAGTSSESICEHFGNVATATNDLTIIDFHETSAFNWILIAL